MDRRTFISSLAALAATTTGALAESRTHFNFNNNGGRRSSTGGSFFSRARYRGKQTVSYRTTEKPGTIIVSTRKRKLYFVLADNKAIEYGVGVGRQGFTWTGAARIARKAEWPAWHPPKEMIEREKKKYGRTLPARMEGGPNNPLGARALYLFQGGRDTLYRIHGTNAPASIGTAQSSGCIRMLNEEVIDLHKRVKIGAKVIVS
ncbi:L,D-transpeptidase [Anderseniella sp. Alg231-50]|uniref:L,D-transpeptidase n=1 Tax=Anderseniella sp. Alg231-50 TaxID=1922226 RepID=UPI00307B3BE7